MLKRYWSSFSPRFQGSLKIFLVWLIILFGMVLRVYQFDAYPIHNNDDGLYHAWSGVSSLRDLANPTSLTIFTKDNPNLIWHSQYNNLDPVKRFSFRIVQPYLDQPPLAMFAIGLPAYLLGYTELTQIPQGLVRLPALVAAIFSLFLTYILAHKTTNYPTAVLALTVYTITPLFVFAQRQSYLENFLTPVILTGLILTFSSLKSKKPSQLAQISILLTAYSAPLIKMVGYALPLILAYWQLRAKNLKFGLAILAAGVSAGLTYVVYGYLINWSHFLWTLGTQAGRGMYFGSFLKIFTTPEFYEPFSDGLYFFGFVTMLALLLRRQTKGERFLATNFIFWLIVVILTSGIYNNVIWYRYPLFPYLAISSGIYLTRLLKKPSLWLVTPLIIFGLTGLDLVHLEFPTSVVRLTYLGLFVPFVLYHFRPNRLTQKIQALGLAVVFLAVLVANLLVPFGYVKASCKHSNCLRPDRIQLNEE